MAITKEDMHAFAYELGLFTLGWSTVEFGLNAWVTIVFQFYQFQDMPPIQPQPLRRRVEFLEAAYAPGAPLEGRASEALGWIGRVKTISDERHWLMKGIASTQLSEPHKTFLKRIDLTPQSNKHLERGVTTQRIKALQKEATALGSAIMNHVVDIDPRS